MYCVGFSLVPLMYMDHCSPIFFTGEYFVFTMVEVRMFVVSLAGGGGVGCEWFDKRIGLASFLG